MWLTPLSPAGARPGGIRKCAWRKHGLAKQFSSLCLHSSHSGCPAVEVTPTFYACICPFYQVNQLKEFHPELGWYSIALLNGFPNYQHLVKNNKQVSGTTPNSLIQESVQKPERNLGIAEDFRGLQNLLPRKIRRHPLRIA